MPVNKAFMDRPGPLPHVPSAPPPSPTPPPPPAHRASSLPEPRGNWPAWSLPSSSRRPPQPQDSYQSPYRIAADLAGRCGGRCSRHARSAAPTTDSARVGAQNTRSMRRFPPAAAPNARRGRSPACGPSAHHQPPSAHGHRHKHDPCGPGAVRRRPARPRAISRPSAKPGHASAELDLARSVPTPAILAQPNHACHAGLRPSHWSHPSPMAPVEHRQTAARAVRRADRASTPPRPVAAPAAAQQDRASPSRWRARPGPIARLRPRPPTEARPLATRPTNPAHPPRPAATRRRPHAAAT